METSGLEKITERCLPHDVNGSDTGWGLKPWQEQMKWSTQNGRSATVTLLNMASWMLYNSVPMLDPVSRNCLNENDLEMLNSCSFSIFLNLHFELPFFLVPQNLIWLICINSTILVLFFFNNHFGSIHKYFEAIFFWSVAKAYFVLSSPAPFKEGSLV